jgi:hypothetical protein
MNPVELVTTLVGDVMNGQQLDRLDDSCDARPPSSPACAAAARRADRGKGFQHGRSMLTDVAAEDDAPLADPGASRSPPRADPGRAPGERLRDEKGAHLEALASGRVDVATPPLVAAWGRQP